MIPEVWTYYSGKEAKSWENESRNLPAESDNYGDEGNDSKVVHYVIEECRGTKEDHYKRNDSNELASFKRL